MTLERVYSDTETVNTILRTVEDLNSLLSLAKSQGILYKVLLDQSTLAPTGMVFEPIRVHLFRSLT